VMVFVLHVEQTVAVSANVTHVGMRSFKLTIGSKESVPTEEEENPHKSLTNGSIPRFGNKWSRQER
jgi:hypothetical protein